MSDTFTMVEFLKTERPPEESAVAKKFIEDVPLMRSLPFETQASTSIDFNQEIKLPTTTNRGIGEEYTATQGTIELGNEPMKLLGGVSSFDSFQVATGSKRRSQEALSFIEGVGRNYSRQFIKGDDTTDTRVIRGLQFRLTKTDTNLLPNGVGNATITKMLEAHGLCRNPTHWLMSREMQQKFTVAAHDTNVGGYIIRGKDEIGQPTTFLADLPIVVVDRDDADVRILGFDEASSTTSIYCVAFRADMLHGIQVAPARAEDIGRSDLGTKHRTLVDWFASLMVRHERAAVRWSEITDAAVTL